MHEQAAFYNEQVVNGLIDGESPIRDPKRFKWDPIAEQAARRGKHVTISDSQFRTAVYRPFFKQALYMDKILNGYVGLSQSALPSQDARTPTIVVESKLPAPGRSQGVLAVETVSTHKTVSGGVGERAFVFPRYVYDLDAADGQASLLAPLRENISSLAVAEYRSLYSSSVSKGDIFAYVYGILHSPDYRERYATDLAKMLPRIPEVASADDFFAFAEAGQHLLDLHIGYEEAEPYQLHEQVAIGAPEGDERWYVEKMKWAGNRKQPDRSTIIVNDWVTLSGIPDEAHRYVVGPRTALEWLIDRYRVKTDKASGIVNDVNDWGLELDPPNPRYIIELIKRVTTVSVETMKIVDNLPPLVEAER